MSVAGNDRFAVPRFDNSDRLFRPHDASASIDMLTNANRTRRHMAGSSVLLIYPTSGWAGYAQGAAAAAKEAYENAFRQFSVLADNGDRDATKTNQIEFVSATPCLAPNVVPARRRARVGPRG